MLIIALTGGIGSGKSLAAQYFSELGAFVLDADELARSAIERGSEGFDEVVATFGDGILRDGQINRGALAEKVFSDPEARRALENIVHPKVRESFELAVEALGEDAILIYEIPLLVETGAKDKFDYVITVESSIETRTERLRVRGMSLRDVNARIASQATSAARSSLADYVIQNDEGPDELLREVEYLWESVIPALKAAKG